MEQNFINKKQNLKTNIQKISQVFHSFKQK